jgi:hypothetical protein
LLDFTLNFSIMKIRTACFKTGSLSINFAITKIVICIATPVWDWLSEMFGCHIKMCVYVCVYITVRHRGEAKV